jgi:hypothetical protein
MYCGGYSFSSLFRSLYFHDVNGEPFSATFAGAARSRCFGFMKLVGLLLFKS